MTRTFTWVMKLPPLGDKDVPVAGERVTWSVRFERDTRTSSRSKVLRYGRIDELRETCRLTFAVFGTAACTTKFVTALQQHELTAECSATTATLSPTYMLPTLA